MAISSISVPPSSLVLIYPTHRFSFIFHSGNAIVRKTDKNTTQERFGMFSFQRKSRRYVRIARYFRFQT